MRTPPLLRGSVPFLLMGVLATCGARADDTGGSPEAGMDPDGGGDVLSVTIDGADGSELGTFSVSPQEVEGRTPSVTRIGNRTSVTMVLMGAGTDIATAVLTTRAPGPGEVGLDAEGETADALQLVFNIPDGPGGVAGQYEPVEGTASLTTLESDRIAGRFAGTFRQQHSDRRYHVEGSFDFRESY